MLTNEYLADRIAYHGRKVQEYTLAHDRAVQHRIGESKPNLEAAAAHAAVFTALTAIAATKS